MVGAGGGVPLMIFRVSSGGLLLWGHFGYLVCVVLLLPGELCPALLVSSTMVLEGIVWRRTLPHQ